MKIVILADNIPPEGKGGAERVAWDSAKALSKKGNSVTVITTSQDPEFLAKKKCEQSTIEGIPVWTIPTSYDPRWRAWYALYNPPPVREIKRLLLSIQPEIVHAHNVHQYFSYAVFRTVRKTLPRTKLLHTIHDAMPFAYGKLQMKNVTEAVCKKEWNYKVSAWKQLKKNRWRYNPIRNIFIRRALKNVPTLLAVSHALVDALAQNGITGVQVLYNGVDAKEWEVPSEMAQEFVRRHNLENKKVLLFGGRISGSKGGDALLAALPSIVATVPNAYLLVMGTENEYVKKFKATAEKMGMTPYIGYTGWISADELRAAYHAASVLVAPTVSFEPLSMVAIESMACATPVVGSCYGGIAEVITDGETGFTVHPLDTASLALKISELLLSDEKAHAFGQAGKRKQQEKFSEEVHMANLLQYYSNYK